MLVSLLNLLKIFPDDQLMTALQHALIKPDECPFRPNIEGQKFMNSPLIVFHMVCSKT